MSCKKLLFLRLGQSREKLKINLGFFFTICVALGRLPFTSCPREATGSNWTSTKSERNSHLILLSLEKVSPLEDLSLVHMVRMSASFSLCASSTSVEGAWPKNVCWPASDHRSQPMGFGAGGHPPPLSGHNNSVGGDHCTNIGLLVQDLLLSSSMSFCSASWVERKKLTVCTRLYTHHLFWWLNFLLFSLSVAIVTRINRGVNISNGDTYIYKDLKRV